ncbi:hypothetical protein V1477_014506 [Vespula maculifrons]|uniref:Uncharacterized protein n=1 Tax=Vespula maculifrons TaxID=7453 RepID=A0ABD2BHZ5_VESMC
MIIEIERVLLRIVDDFERAQKATEFHYELEVVKTCRKKNRQAGKEERKSHHTAIDLRSIPFARTDRLARKI